MSLREKIIGTPEARRLYCDLFGIPRSRLAGRPSADYAFLQRQLSMFPGFSPDDVIRFQDSVPYAPVDLSAPGAARRDRAPK